MSANRLFLSSPVRAALFELEILGQLSDGRWENARPFDHWKPWAEAQIEIAAAGHPVGRSFSARKTYNLCDAELLDAVSDRMRGYARIAELWGLDAARSLRQLVDCDGKLPDGDDPYWVALREKISAALVGLGVGLSVVQIELGQKLDQTWPMKRLRSELRGLKREMETALGAGA